MARAGFEGPLETSSTGPSAPAASSGPSAAAGGRSGIKLGKKAQLGAAAAAVAVLALVMGRRGGGSQDFGEADTTATDLYGELQPQLEGLQVGLDNLSGSVEDQFGNLNDAVLDLSQPVTPGTPEEPEEVEPGPRGPRGPRGPKGKPGKAGGGRGGRPKKPKKEKDRTSPAERKKRRRRRARREEREEQGGNPGTGGVRPPITDYVPGGLPWAPPSPPGRRPGAKPASTVRGGRQAAAVRNAQPKVTAPPRNQKKNAPVPAPKGKSAPVRKNPIRKPGRK
ncbi:hypothetical protein JOE61_003860 [Nocardioides salarius]|uniref:Uncharacterized protein n=1 Tax=Nocardioides salarius TaxID=374513 RepID=A0ABS2MFS9_9ACTN|nr:hypothetical protein [Nocardioides salarius]MBM7510046.1 hypothetical protein [Nocardioides salarius]